MCTDFSGFRRKRVFSSDMVTITKRAGTADRPTKLHSENNFIRTAEMRQIPNQRRNYAGTGRKYKF